MDRFIPPAAEPRATLVEGARVIDPAAGIDDVHDLLIDETGVQLDPSKVPAKVQRVEGRKLWALPGLIDIQVHFRQPGFEHKETLESGSRAALAGGVTTAVVMPNTKPTLDTPEGVRFQADEARRVEGIRLLVAAAATRGLGGRELTDHGALARAGAVAISDDGLPVMDDALMAASLAACAEHDLLFMQHAEDLTISQHGVMTEGPTSRKLGFKAQPADAEGAMVERDIRLATAAGARYHVLHTSTARSLAAVRAAKAAGQRVSCEASPHHLLLTDEACAKADPNTKMNPPLRCEADRQALIAALADGTVDAVATDHAPHSAEEKDRGFVDGPFGVIGLETAFAALLSFFHAGVIDRRRAVALMTSGPAAVLGRSDQLGTLLPQAGCADVCLVDPRRQWTVDRDAFHGRSHNSAFYGWAFDGRVRATFLRGHLRYLDDASLLA